MDLRQGVAALCKTLEVPLPEVDPAGRYLLPFDGDMELRCFVLAGNPILEGVVRPLPEDHQAEEALLKRLLNMSLGKARDRTESLLVDETSREIRLHRRLPSEIDAGPGFIEAVEQFLNELEFWRKHASEGPQQSAATSPFSLRP